MCFSTLHCACGRWHYYPLVSHFHHSRAALWGCYLSLFLPGLLLYLVSKVHPSGLSTLACREPARVRRQGVDCMATAWGSHLGTTWLPQQLLGMEGGWRGCETQGTRMSGTCNFHLLVAPTSFSLKALGIA